MITVHHLNQSRSHRVLWLLEELEVPYEVVNYQRDARTLLAPPELRRVHPLGKSPVITDEGRTIAESGAIIEYLVERYGHGRGLAPAVGTDEHLRYRYWLHYAEGSAMPILLMKLVFMRIPKPPMPAVLRPFAKLISMGVQTRLLDPQLKNHMQYWAEELRRGGWFAGEAFTAADIQMSFAVEAAVGRSGRTPAPEIDGFLKRIHQRPAYQRAEQKGGEFKLPG
jgi:glutathione S-transferase